MKTESQETHYACQPCMAQGHEHEAFAVHTLRIDYRADDGTRAETTVGLALCAAHRAAGNRILQWGVEIAPNDIEVAIHH